MKPVARRVPSDDCEVTDGAAVYRPHEGESVEVRAGIRVGELRRYRVLAELDVQILSVQGEDQAHVKQLQLMEGGMAEACAILADRIVGWDWTDDHGRPLPQPADDPTVFERLDLDEIRYLIAVARGESPGERKNGSRPSPTTSSGTPSRRTRRR